jgi:hypothetical protein
MGENAIKKTVPKGFTKKSRGGGGGGGRRRGSIIFSAIGFSRFFFEIMAL